MLEKVALGRDKVRVTFRISKGRWADHIVVVGDFDTHQTQTYALMQTRDDEDWHTSLELPSGGVYRFYYLVDDHERVNDNHADAYVANPHGGVESVLYT